MILASQELEDSNSRLAERFQGRRKRGGLSAKLKGRLGNINFKADNYDSGDSLERDDGADLKLDTGEAANMVIQVQHSDGEQEGNDEDMETNDNTSSSVFSRRKKSPVAKRATSPRRRRDQDVDHRVQHHRDVDGRHRSPADLRHKVSSQVVKIKQEKADEDRAKRDRYARFFYLVSF